MKQAPQHDGCQNIRRKNSLPLALPWSSPVSANASTLGNGRSHLRFRLANLAFRGRWTKGVALALLLSCSFVQTGTAAEDGAPEATPSSPSAVTTTSATLSARVNPNGSATTALVEYGPTANYGKVASFPLSPVDGTTLQEVSVGITGLSPHTAYHYRVTATNAHGAAISEDAVFTTDNTTPDAPVLSPNTLPENAAVKFGIGTLGLPRDADGDSLTYTLVSGLGGSDNTLFCVDGTVLRSMAVFDYEAPRGSIYHIRIRVSDGFGGAIEKPLIVQVTDVQYPSPVLLFSLPGTAVRTDSIPLSASAVGGPVTFSVISGPGEIFNGNILTFTGTGTVKIEARQSGGSDYAPASATAIVTVLWNEFPLLADDAVTITAGSATVYPLANDRDPDGDELTITGVSEPGAVSIEGRRLVITDNVLPAFWYSATDSHGATQTALVTVKRTPPQENTVNWAGLLMDEAGMPSGILRAARSAGGMMSARLSSGTRSARIKFRMPALGSTTVTTRFGTITIREDSEKQLVVSMGGLKGRLRPCLDTAGQQQYNIGLASIDREIPGGGTARVLIRKNGGITALVRLPNGFSFSTTSQLADNLTFAMYAAFEKKRLDTAVGGEFVLADLAATDLTAELSWGSRSKRQDQPGQNLSTTLVGNGCVYSDVSELPSGPVVIEAAQGTYIPMYEWTTAAEGQPAATFRFPRWHINRRTGTFTATYRRHDSVFVPAGGVYLPKTNSAWGWYGNVEERGLLRLLPEVELSPR